MRIELIISGFGGQGILFAGNLIALSAMMEGHQVTYLPVYGPEMRGGTCNCTVIISQNEIASPLIYHPSFLIIMNYPSFLKFMPNLKKGGSAIINSDLVKPKEIEDLQTLQKKYRLYFIPATSLAETINAPLLANLCVLGAFYQITKIFKLKNFKKALRESLGSEKADLFEPNLKAFKLGAKYIKQNFK